MTVGELIDRLGGELIHGDATTLLAGVAEVKQAKELDLVFGENQASVETATYHPT